MSQFKELQPPFEIYYNGVEIADKNGHVCSAENKTIAEDILKALNEYVYDENKSQKD